MHVLCDVRAMALSESSVLSAITLRESYAVSGTESACFGLPGSFKRNRRKWLTGTSLRTVLRMCYGLSGTDAVLGARIGPRNVWY